MQEWVEIAGFQDHETSWREKPGNLVWKYIDPKVDPYNLKNERHFLGRQKVEVRKQLKNI